MEPMLDCMVCALVGGLVLLLLLGLLYGSGK